MVYTILISIVFIAELIIAITIFQYLRKIDRAILQANNSILELKPKIKEISELIYKISGQWIILTQDFVDKLKLKAEDMMLKQVSKALMTFLVINLNLKFIKKIRRSKVFKTFAKGWSFLESMI